MFVIVNGNNVNIQMYVHMEMFINRGRRRDSWDIQNINDKVILDCDILGVTWGGRRSSKIRISNDSKGEP